MVGLFFLIVSFCNYLFLLFLFFRVLLVHSFVICRYFREMPVAEPRYRSMSGTRMNVGVPGTGSGAGIGTGTGGGGRNLSYRFRSPGAPLVGKIAEPRRSTEPKLTIIDFNQLTKGGLDLATGKNRAKVVRRASPRRLLSRRPRR